MNTTSPINGRAIGAAIVLLLLAACRTNQPTIIPGPVRTDTLYIHTHARDSIHLHDSTHIHEARRADTLIITTEHWHTHYRDRWHRDTIYIARHDTLTRTVTLTRDRRPTLWQRLRPLLAGIPLGALLLGLLIIRLRR